MLCTHGHPNPDGQRFCGECGESLDQTAASNESEDSEWPEPVSHSAKDNSRPWAPVVTALSLLFCFPLGLVLLWTITPWSQRTKSWLTASVATVVAVALVLAITGKTDEKSAVAPGRLSQTARTTLREPASTSTTAPTTTIDPLIAAVAYKAGARDLPYVQLVKDPYALRDAAVHYRGRVFQYDFNTGLTAMLVQVTQGKYGYWSDLVYVTIPNAEAGTNITKDTVVNFWGDVAGVYSYSTQSGSNSVPRVNAKYIEVE